MKSCWGQGVDLFRPGQKVLEHAIGPDGCGLMPWWPNRCSEGRVIEFPRRPEGGRLMRHSVHPLREGGAGFYDRDG